MSNDIQGVIMRQYLLFIMFVIRCLPSSALVSYAQYHDGILLSLIPYPCNDCVMRNVAKADFLAHGLNPVLCIIENSTKEPVVLSAYSVSRLPVQQRNKLVYSLCSWPFSSHDSLLKATSAITACLATGGIYALFKKIRAVRSLKASIGSEVQEDLERADLLTDNSTQPFIDVRIVIKGEYELRHTEQNRLRFLGRALCGTIILSFGISCAYLAWRSYKYQCWLQGLLVGDEPEIVEPHTIVYKLLFFDASIKKVDGDFILYDSTNTLPRATFAVTM